MRRTKIVIIVGLFATVFGFFYWRNLDTKPVNFLKNQDINQAYLEFRTGGDPSFTSKYENGHLEISNPDDLSLLKKEIENLELDWNAPHRPSDFSVYINFKEYRERKWELKMDRINGGIVFSLGQGLYRNERLAAFVIEKMEIKN